MVPADGTVYDIDLHLQAHWEFKLFGRTLWTITIPASITLAVKHIHNPGHIDREIEIKDTDGVGYANARLTEYYQAHDAATISRAVTYGFQRGD